MLDIFFFQIGENGKIPKNLKKQFLEVLEIKFPNLEREKGPKLPNFENTPNLENWDKTWNFFPTLRKKLNFISKFEINLEVFFQIREKPSKLILFS